MTHVLRITCVIFTILFHGVQASSVLGNPDDNIVEDAAGFSGSVEDDGVWGNVDNNDGGGLPAVSNRTISGNRFPYVVSIRRFGQHLCTGTIVDATTILTSAVCLQYNTFELFVVAGVEDFAEENGSAVQRSVVDVAKHQNLTKLNPDIGLVFLDEPLQWSASVQPAKLPSQDFEDPREGSNLTALGWNGQHLAFASEFPPNEKEPTELRSTNLTYVNDDQCRQLLGNKYPVEPEDLCASPTETDNPCEVGLGGPLVDENGVVVGVISSRVACMMTGVRPSVHSQVSHHLPWIASQSEQYVSSIQQPKVREPRAVSKKKKVKALRGGVKRPRTIKGRPKAKRFKPVRGRKKRTKKSTSPAKKPPSKIVTPGNNGTNVIVEPYIVNGGVARPGQFPFMVSIQKQSLIGGKYRHHCGGTILNPILVITAAHCLASVKKPSDISILGGSTRLLTYDSSAVRRSVAHFVIHEGFSAVVSDPDVGIIFLKEKFTYNKFIKPAYVPAKDYEDPPLGSNLIVMGYGSHNPSLFERRLATAMNKGKRGLREDNNYELRYVTVPYITDNECQRLINGIPMAPKLGGHTLCVMENGRGACQGDSGGPLVDKNGVLLGIVSFGEGCARPNNPGMYEQVSYYLGWVTKWYGAITKKFMLPARREPAFTRAGKKPARNLKLPLLE